MKLARRLSPGQESLWLIQQLDPSSSAYTVPGTLCFPYVLDSTIVVEALNALATRHAILRMSYHLARDGVVRVRESANILPELTTRKSDCRETTQHLLETFNNEPFLLDIGAPWRTLLVHEKDRSSILCVAVHHIATDGVSRSIMLSELAQLCDGAVHNYFPNLSPIGATFAEHVDLIYASRTEERVSAGVRYWTEHLAGLSPPSLPKDQSVGSSLSSSGNRTQLDFDPITTEAMQKAAFKLRASLAAVVASATSIGLWRWTGEEDVGFGFFLAGRHGIAFSNTVGFFVNTVVLRCAVGAGSTAREVVSQTQQNLTLAATHQDTPFATVVKDLKVKRRAGENPVFNVALAHHPEAKSKFNPLPDGVSVIEEERCVVRFDVEISTQIVDGCFQLAVRYRSALFRASTANRLSSYIRDSLESILLEPDKMLGSRDSFGANNQIPGGSDEH